MVYSSGFRLPTVGPGPRGFWLGVGFGECVLGAGLGFRV